MIHSGSHDCCSASVCCSSTGARRRRAGRRSRASRPTSAAARAATAPTATAARSDRRSPRASRCARTQIFVALLPRRASRRRHARHDEPRGERSDGARAAPAHAQAAERLRPGAHPGAARGRWSLVAGLVMNRGLTDLQVLGDDRRIHLLRARRRSLPRRHLAGRLADLQRRRRGAAATARSRRSTRPTSRALAPKWMFNLPNTPRLQGTPVVVERRDVRHERQRVLRARRGQRAARSGATSARARKGMIGNAGGGINRGAAVAGDRVFMATDHAHLIALDRATGALVWDTEMADWRQNYGATGAPLDGRQPGDLGRVRRRRGRARVRRRLRSGHRQGSVAVLDRAAARRAGLGDVEGRCDRSPGRRHVADRHLRSRARHALLAGRQPGPGLHRRRPRRRQPLHELDRRARRHDAAR